MSKFPFVIGIALGSLICLLVLFPKPHQPPMAPAVPAPVAAEAATPAVDPAPAADSSDDEDDDDDSGKQVPDDWQPKGAVVTHIGQVGDCDIWRVHPRESTTTMYVTESKNRHAQCHAFQAR